MTTNPSREQIAEAVFLVLGGSVRSFQSLLSGHRGSPREADLRAVCWKVWRDLNGVPNYSETAKHWDRDRRSIARGLQRIADKRFVSQGELLRIMQLLGATD